MFCPNCAAAAAPDQSFCRSCGISLTETAEALTRQLPSAERARALRRQRNLDRFGVAATAGFGAISTVGVVALVYVVLTKLVWSGGSPVVGLLLAAFIVSAALLLLFVILRETGGADQVAGSDGSEDLASAPPAPAGLSPATTAALDDGREFSPASVIENTTRPLPVESRSRK